MAYSDLRMQKISHPFADAKKIVNEDFTQRPKFKSYVLVWYNKADMVN